MSQSLALYTERLVLRPLRSEDAPAVRELGGDGRIAEMTLLPHPFESEAAENWVRARIERAEEGSLLPFSILSRERDEIMGHFGLALDRDNENARLYYWLGVSYWGRGYVTEAGREVIRYIFEDLGLRRVYAEHFARNPASGRVLEKIGMRQEGCMRQHYKKWDRFEDIVLYGVLAEEWVRDRIVILGLHHAQITIPEGSEDAARDFYCRLLGLEEIEKPESLAGRGGLWLRAGDRQVHIGVENGVDRSATKSHLAYEVDDLDATRRTLDAEGCEILDPPPIPGYGRFETRDPFGNRVEFIRRMD